MIYVTSQDAKWGQDTGSLTYRSPAEQRPQGSSSIGELEPAG